MGDRPLRSPTHRCLGGPSPRLPANGTHARPRPHRCFIHKRMPSWGTMGAYPAFPPAIALSGVGCIRVTHPCATLVSRRTFTVRLACIRPAASVHPEPGSNSSLYYCTTKFCFPEITGLAVCSLPSLLPYRRPASRQTRLDFLLCWPSSFQRTLANSPLFQAPLPFVCGCKSTTFSFTSNNYFHYFSNFFHSR